MLTLLEFRTCVDKGYFIALSANDKAMAERLLLRPSLTDELRYASACP